MVIGSAINPRIHQDSVKLMRIHTAAAELPGVAQAACIMGTDRNKAALAASGLLTQEARPPHRMTSSS